MWLRASHHLILILSIVEQMPDPPDPQTGYNATAEVLCGFAGAEPTGRCAAGVKRT